MWPYKCQKYACARASAPDPAEGAYDTPQTLIFSIHFAIILYENKGKIKRLYEGETANLSQLQVGNEMEMVGNCCVTPFDLLIGHTCRRITIKKCLLDMI